MAFPTVSARATGSESSAVTSHSITLPTHSVGQMLVVLFDATSVTHTTLTVNGASSSASWVHLGARNDATRNTLHVFWKIADSTSETLTLTTTAGERSAHVSYAVSDANWINGTMETLSTGANPNPPSHTEDASRDYLWIACAASGAGAVTASAAPTNYTNLQTATGSTNCGISTAERTVTATTEDPGTFTASSDEFVVATLAIGNRGTNTPRIKIRDFGICGSQSGWENIEVSSTNVNVTDSVTADTNFDVDGIKRRVIRADLFHNAIAAGSSTHYLRWQGTFEDLGIEPGRTITGYDDITVKTKAIVEDGPASSHTMSATFSSLQIIDPTTRTLISDVGGDISGASPITGSITTTSNDPAVTGLSIASDTSIEIRLNMSFSSSAASASGSSGDMDLGDLQFDVTLQSTSGGDYASTTTAAATVTGNLNVSRDMIAAPAATATVSPSTFAGTVRYVSTTTAAATVTGNIDESKRFLGSVVGQSVLGPTPSLARLRVVAATTTATALVSPTVFVAGTLIAAVAATSTASATLDRQPKFSTTVAATATVTPSVRNITPQFASTTAATASLPLAALSLGKPFIAAKATGQSGSQTQYTVPLPTHRAGQMLVIFCGFGDNNSPAWDTVGSTAGWRCERQGGNLAGTDVGGAWYYKMAESSSEVLVAESFSSEKFHTVAYAIDDANGYFIRSHNQGLFSATSTPAFRDITLNQSRDVISFAAVYGEADSIMTVAPTGYTIDETLQGGGSFNDGSVSVAIKEANLSSEAPSTATMSASAAHCSTTFICYLRDPGEQYFEYRTGFNDSTSYFDTSALDPHVMDNDWLNGSSYGTIGFPSWSTAQAGPSTSDLFDDAFWTLRSGNFGTTTDTSYVEFTTTWEELGLPATTSITGYQAAEIHYQVANITGSQTGRPGTASNGAVEIIDPNGTTTLIAAPGTHTANTAWLQLTDSGSIDFSTTPYLATETIKLRIYTEGEDPLSETSCDIYFEDLRITATALDNLVSFATTVAATSTVTSLFALPRLFDTSLSVTSNVTPDLSVATSYFAASLSETSNVLGELNTPPLIVGTTSTTGTTGSNSITIPTGGQVGDLILTFIAHEADGGLGDNEAGDPSQVPYARVIGFNGGGTAANGIDNVNRWRARIRNATGTETFSYVGVAVYVRFWQEGDSSFSTSMVYPEGGSGNQPFAATTYLIRNANVVASASGGSGNFVDLFTGGSGTNPSPTTFRQNLPGYTSVNGAAWTSSGPASFFKADTGILDINGVSIKSLVTGSQAQSSAPSGMSNLTTVTNTVPTEDVTIHTARHEQRDLSTFNPGDYSGATTSWASINVFLFEDSDRTIFRSATVSASSGVSAYLTNLFRADSTTTATSTVTANLVIEKAFASTTTATALVNGNIDETRKLVSATVAQSALVDPTQFDLQLSLASTTNAVATVTPSMILDLVFESTTNAAATASGEFFFGYETVVTLNSTVTASLAVSRPIDSAIAASSTTTQNVDRAVDWQVSLAPTSTITLGNVLIDRPLRADFNGNHVLEAGMRLAGKFATVINATSTVTPTFDRGPGFISTTAATSTVTAQTGRGIVIASALVAQSVLGPNPNLAVTRTIASALASTSATTIGQINRAINYAITPITVTTLISGTVVVITNTLELTWTSGEYFTEVAPCVLQLTSDTYNDTAVVNEVIDDISITDETLDDVLLGDECNPVYIRHNLFTTDFTEDFD